MTDWQRLEQVIKWAGKNTNSFAKEISLNRTENLYQIKKGNNRISKSLANRIVLVFPAINKTWLIFGEGEMLLDQNATPYPTKPVKNIPFYEGNIYEILTSPEEKLPESVYNINVPNIGECDMAIRVNSTSLEPNILLGSILLIQKIEIDDIMYGYKYLITTNEGCMLRIVKRDKTLPDSIIIKSLNPDFETSINKNEIETIHIIKASISLF